jgi:hypothetical protein
MKSDAWPFVPPVHHKKLGESPFRVRGLMYAGHLERIQKNVPDGLSTVCAAIGIKDVEVFLRETIFLATASYDIEPMMHIMRVVAQLNHTPLDKFIRNGSHIAAEKNIAGTYRAQLRSTSTEDMATRLPRMFVRYFEPCRIETLSVQSNATELRMGNLPTSAMGFYVWTTEGFVAGALAAVGARDVHFNWISQASDGELEGVALQSIGCRVTWTNSTP